MAARTSTRTPVWTQMASYNYGCQFRAANLGEAVDVVTTAFNKAGFELPPGTTNLSFDKYYTKKELDQNYRPTMLLGFDLASVGHELLEVEPGVIVLLPCNVSVAKCDEEGVFEMSVISPKAMAPIMDNKKLTRDIIMGADRKVRDAMKGIPTDEDLRQFSWFSPGEEVESA